MDDHRDEQPDPDERDVVEDGVGRHEHRRPLAAVRAEDPNEPAAERRRSGERVAADHVQAEEPERHGRGSEDPATIPSRTIVWRMSILRRAVYSVHPFHVDGTSGEVPLRGRMAHAVTFLWSDSL